MRAMWLRDRAVLMLCSTSRFPLLRVRHPVRAGRSLPISGRMIRMMNAHATSIQLCAGQSVHSAAVSAAGSVVGICNVPKSIIVTKIIIFVVPSKKPFSFAPIIYLPVLIIFAT